MFLFRFIHPVLQICFLIILGAGSNATLQAQTLSATINAIRNGEEFGRTISGNVLLNGDSVPDFVIGGPRPQSGGSAEGKVYVFSGSNSQLIRTLAADSSVDTVTNNFFGNSLATLGDLNSDGVPDIVVGAPSPNGIGFVRFFSGSNGNSLGVAQAFNQGTGFGTSLAALGDVTADGIPDAVVAEPANSGGLTLFLVSGSTTHTRWQLPSSPTSPFYLTAGIADVDGDYYDDILVATTAPNSYYAFDLVSGNSKTLIESRCVGAGSYPNCSGASQLIVSALGLNDVNNDGVGDFALGMPSGLTGTGEVQIRSGANRSVIRTLSNQTLGDLFGSSLANMGDQDGDGADDIAVGAVSHASPNPSNGYVKCFSGKTGQALYTINGSSTSGAFAFSIANAGDVNGDGVIDILIGEPNYDPGSAPATGRVHLYYGPSCLAQSRVNTVILPSDDGYQILTHHMNGCA